MKCTRCKQGELKSDFLDDTIPCRTCDACGGNWILLRDYLGWKERNPGHVFVDPKLEEIPEAPKHAFVCPVTGSLMVPYRISKETLHRIDLSPRINGIWLDKGEWDLLKSEGLAGSLNRIFTDPWQRKIRADSTRDVYSALYTEQFGEADYARIMEIRAWLAEHPKREGLMAYLIDDDPYSATR